MKACICSIVKQIWLSSWHKLFLLFLQYHKYISWADSSLPLSLAVFCLLLSAALKLLKHLPDLHIVVVGTDVDANAHVVVVGQKEVPEKRRNVSDDDVVHRRHDWSSRNGLPAVPGQLADLELIDSEFFCHNDNSNGSSSSNDVNLDHAESSTPHSARNKHSPPTSASDEFLAEQRLVGRIAGDEFALPRHVVLRHWWLRQRSRRHRASLEGRWKFWYSCLKCRRWVQCDEIGRFIGLWATFQSLW